MTGMAFTLYGGHAWWDRAGVRHNSWRGTKYYRFNGQTVAMRKNGVLSYLHGDHLGSTVATSNSSGTFSGQEWYHAYGRYRGGHELGTENRFTGQKLDGAGLMYFNARYYDPELGHFLSPDTLVPDPGNLFDYNRYMYVRGNAMNAVDPSGHFCVPVVNMGTTCQGSTDWDAVQSSLDATGIVDPTPISDGANAVISVVRGNYSDAGWSVVAIVPVIGDLGKVGKYVDEAMVGARWVGDKADEGWQAAKRWTDCLINSFSAKTLVMTPSGLKAISELVEGELVLAYNEATGEIGAYPITDVISHVDPEIVLLTIDGETLETTADHPFYELESAPWLAVGQTAGRWTDALDLQAGDRVWKADGASGVVQSVEVALVQQRMYNLTVAEAHTFFVGEQQWLVHNSCFRGPAAKGFDWDHIFRNHSDLGQGALQSGKKTIFEGLTDKQIQARVQGAWTNRELLKSQVGPDGATRMLYSGLDEVSGQKYEVRNLFR